MKRYALLFLIILVALFLRFWHISQTPPSLSHDEVAIGYNAWSVLTTGNDEYGTPHPLLFRSFDDYKLPGYIYFTALSEKLFGLNEFAVRFPSALFGVLTVILLYFLLRELLSDKKTDKIFYILPLISASLLAISPWHVNFSRAAFEANGSLFFLVLGMLFLLKGRKNPKNFIFAAVSFAVAIYFYYTARVIVPVLVITHFLLYRKDVIQAKKLVGLALITGFILLLPLVPSMFSSGLSRVNQVSIFEDKSLTNPYTQALSKNHSIVAKVMYNRRFAYLQEFLDNYLKNFAPDFYFTNGTGPMGLLYIWEIPFFLYGLYTICRIKDRWKWMVLAWFFSVPIVGGLTLGQPNALRTLANVPMVVLFSAFGIYEALLFVMKKKYLILFLTIFFFFVGLFLIRFMILYFDYYPSLTASLWGDGHKQMAQFIKENKDTYDNIYITGDYWRPYIYMLFYMQYDPSLYQERGTRDGFSNIYFGQAIWDRGEGLNLAKQNLSLLVKRKTLFILSPNDFQAQQNLRQSDKIPYTLVVVKEIGGVFVKPAFYAVTLQ